MGGRIDALFRLDGKCAVVAGGAGRLGTKVCEILAEAGADVVIVDQIEDSARREAVRIGAESGRRVLARAADITSEDAVVALAEAVTADFGRPADILVNTVAFAGNPDFFQP